MRMVEVFEHGLIALADALKDVRFTQLVVAHRRAWSRGLCRDAFAVETRTRSEAAPSLWRAPCHRPNNYLGVVCICSDWHNSFLSNLRVDISLPSICKTTRAL